MDSLGQAAVHYTIVNSYGPLVNALPLSLAHLSYGMPQHDDVEQTLDTRYRGPIAPINLGRVAAYGKGLTQVKVKAQAQAQAQRAPSPASQHQTPLIGENGKQAASRASNEQPTVPSRRPSQLDLDLPSPTLGLGPKSTGRGDFASDDTTPAVPTVPGPPRDDVSVRSRRSVRSNRGEESDATRIESHELATFPTSGDDDNYSRPDTPADPSSGDRTPPKTERGADADDGAAGGNVDIDIEAQRPGGKEGRGKNDAGHDDDAEADNPFFALPGGPGVRPPRQLREDDPDAFLHPAVRNPQMVVWLPRDELGLCDAEVHKNRECGVATSSRHAVLNGDVSD